MNSIVPPTLEQATISSSGPKYDAAYLKELKATTPSARPPGSSNVDPYDANMSVDLDDMPSQSMAMDVGTSNNAF
jgi:GC-rich sequence DNA-binding factor